MTDSASGGADVAAAAVRSKLAMKDPETGFLCLVLHAHLPYIRHPEFDRFLEEDWLFEAILETYLPLLQVFERLVELDAPFRVTFSLSPTLTAMLNDRLLQDRFIEYLDRLVELARKEVKRTAKDATFQPLAQAYLDHFRKSRSRYLSEYRRDLISAFRRLQEAGVLEIMTCGATHGFLPLMLGNRNLWRGQIETAVADHTRVFGRAPRGMWLPECGYVDGVDEVLSEANLQYFFLDTHGILHARPRPKMGVYAPVRTPAGVFALGRDQHSSQQVWSSKVGYPGHEAYREFYRDVGWDLGYDYLRPYLHEDGKRTNLGIKYYRVTGKDEKEPYDFAAAATQADSDAADFLQKRTAQAETLHDHFGRRCLAVAPFDAELFGHWWYEGPQWLDFLFRKMHFDQNAIQSITVPEYLERHPAVQQVQPSMSSWGHNGFCEYWLDKSNDWMYPHLHMAGERMIALANRFPDRPDGATARALDQAARELLLAQSSDWAFILKTGTMTDYAGSRVRRHIENFTKLHADLEAGTIDEAWLAKMETDHAILPELDYRVYADRE